MKNTQKLFIISITIIFVSFYSFSFAQTKKEISTKMDQLKGKVEKVTIKVDGKDVVFEGKEAQDLVDKIHPGSKMIHRVWISDDGDVDNIDDVDSNVFVVKVDKGDLNWNEKDKNKKIVEIKIEDGNKKVSVTTSENGKEVTNVYEGDEAEKYLKENEEEGKFEIFDIDKNDGKDIMIFFRNDSADDDCCCCCGRKNRRMKLRMDGQNEKKIIIEKIEKDNKSNDDSSETK